MYGRVRAQVRTQPTRVLLSGRVLRQGSGGTTGKSVHRPHLAALARARDERKLRLGLRRRYQAARNRAAYAP
jgi:hypothetical protein